MIRIETTGSFWLVEVPNPTGLYLRLPKQEGPRWDDYGIPHPEWGTKPGPAQDGVWHSLVRVAYILDWDDQHILCLRYADEECRTHPCPRQHYILTGAVLSPPEPDLEVVKMADFPAWIEGD